MRYFDFRDNTFEKIDSNLSTGGALLKGIVYIDGIKHHIKFGTFNSLFGFYGYETIVEYINCKIGKLLGINVLDVEICETVIELDEKTYNTYVSLTRDFVGDLKSISIEKLYDTIKLNNESVLDMVKRLGLQREVYKEFVYDYIICNMDRHGRNTELLIDKSGNIKLAPFFDNSLTPLITKSETAMLNFSKYYDDSKVNNFIGTLSLRDNIDLIDKDIEINDIHVDKNTLFDVVTNVSDAFMNYAVWLYNSRIKSLKEIGNKHIIFR